MRFGGSTWKIVIGSAVVLTLCVVLAINILPTKKAVMEPTDKSAKMVLLRNETIHHLEPMWKNAAYEYMENPGRKGTLIIQIPEEFTVFVPCGRGRYEGSETNWARVDSALPITVTLMRDAEVAGDFVWEPEANRVDTLAIR